VTCIERNEVVQLLHDKGQHAQAHEAMDALPDAVDPERHRGVLAHFDLNSGELRHMADRRRANWRAAGVDPDRPPLAAVRIT